MGMHSEALKYEAQAALNVGTTATIPRLTTWTEGDSMQTALDKIAATITGASAVSFADDGRDMPNRFVATCDAVNAAAADRVNAEACYGAIVHDAGGTRQIELVKILDASWVNGTDTRGDSRNGKLAKSVTVVSAGALEALSGGSVEPKAYPAGGSSLTVGGGAFYAFTDIGPFRGLVRVFRNTGGTATGGAHPRSARWR